MSGAQTSPLYLRHLGQGPRRVLALHCTIAHGGAWRGLAAVMEQEVTLTAPDLLTHGRSPDWDKTGDYQDNNLDAVLPLLDQPMDLIGHSFGATVALRLAALRPDLVRSLTMIEPVLFAVARADDPAVMEQHSAVEAPFFEAVMSGDHALGARLFNRAWSTSDSPRWADLPEPTRANMIRAIHVVPACANTLYNDTPGLLQPGVLDRLKMPVLLLRGTQTHPPVAVINEGLARRLPNADSVVVEGAGHMLPITHPVETATHWRRLLTRAGDQ